MADLSTADGKLTRTLCALSTLLIFIGASAYATSPRSLTDRSGIGGNLCGGLGKNNCTQDKTDLQDQCPATSKFYTCSAGTYPCQPGAAGASDCNTIAGCANHNNDQCNGNGPS